MSHEDEITTGPFDETDEHDYSDHHHHHHQQEHEQEQWNNDDKNEHEHEHDENKTDVATKRNLYVSNLSFETNEDTLRDKFSAYGEIANIEIVRDPSTKQSRGFGFITYVNSEDGENAVNSLNGAEINGRPVRVEFSKRSHGHSKTPGRYLGPKGTSARFNDRDRRGRYDNGYHNGGGPRRRSGSRDRRPSYGGGYRNDRRSRSKDRAPYGDRGWGGDGRYDSRPDSRGPPPPGDRWSGGGGGRRSRSRSRDRGPGGSRPSYGGYDNRRDRR